MSGQDATPPPPEVLEAETAAAPAERDAVVFLAGIGTVELGDSVDDTARRLANAFDDEADAADQFVIEEGQDEDYGSAHGGRKCSTRKITISRKAGAKGPEKPLVDLYSLDYRKTLVGDLTQRTPFRILLQIAVTILMLAPKLLFAVRSRGKSSAEKWQVRYAWFLFFVLGLYAVIVAVAFLGTLPGVLDERPDQEVAAAAGGAAQPAAAAQLEPPAQGAASELAETAGEAGEAEPPPADDVQSRAEELAGELRGWLAAGLQPLSRWLQIIIVWLTAIGLFFKRDIKGFIEKSGVETLSATNYLSADRRKDSIAQQFSALLNHLGEKSDVRYRNIYVLTYSFGGVVAIDTLLPRGEPRRSLALVTRLVTVACPFDFIRTYWPDYFDKRQAGYDSRDWLNVYTPADVLSSDFRDVSEEGEGAEAGVRLKDGGELVRPGVNICYGNDKSLEEYGPGERYLLVGFRNHTGYWEEETAGCFGSIVKQLFPEAVASPG